jgi:RNA polymerase sigma-70 factor, ECF subfamily
MTSTVDPSTLPAPPCLGDAAAKAISALYSDSCAPRYGISAEQFQQFVSAVVTKYAANAPESEQLQVLEKLHLDALILARACSLGNDAAWDTFLTRFRALLYESAYSIAGNEAAGRELADELYASLWGMPNSDGRRVSKLDYYMGRGSLEGWLRTVLAQRHIDYCRARAKTVSLEEQIESGSSFPAPPEPVTTAPDPRLSAVLNAAIGELPAEDRYVLASYYLDQRTLADLARTLRVHESTMSRRLDRITTQLHKSVVKRLRAFGLSARQCDELLEDLDVRDLNLDLGAKLQQESPGAAFYNKDGSAP